MKKVEKIKLKCLICNKEITILPSKLKGGCGKYCSQKCLHIWQSENFKGKNNPNYKGAKIKKVCSHCSKEFVLYSSALMWNHGKYCSVKCRNLHDSESYKGKNNPNWKGGKIEVNCLVCNKKILKKKSVLKIGSGKFCSYSCNNMWKNSHSKKENTSIEIAIENELIKRHIPYMKQVPIPIAHTVVDFLLPNKIIVYADGDYWHNLPKAKDKDTNQDFILKFNGYKVYRFWEYEINNSPSKCIDKIINSHQDILNKEVMNELKLN